MNENVDLVASMRKYTEWTGIVTQRQLKTMNLWPLIFIEVKSHELKVDLDNQEVHFILTLKPKKKLDQLKFWKTFQAGVWMLLGDSWKTVIFVNKKEVFRGLGNPKEK